MYMSVAYTHVFPSALVHQKSCSCTSASFINGVLLELFKSTSQERFFGSFPPLDVVIELLH